MKFDMMAVSVTSLIIGAEAVYGFSVYPIQPFGMVTLALTKQALGDKKFNELLAVCKECDKKGKVLRGYFTGEISIGHVAGSWENPAYKFELEISGFNELFIA